MNGLMIVFMLALVLVKFADRKLATRKGDVIYLEDVIKESVATALEIINEKNPELRK